MKKTKTKKIKNQFVLVIGDDGAILCHYVSNKLSSRIFVDSPTSADVGLFEKLLGAYTSHPLTVLVDVIEQNYTHQVLPPVSSMGIVPQIQRRLKRDLNPEDLNNFMVYGRSKDGRKDWNVLFVSLANSEPFASWLKFVKKQNNIFGGIFLVPLESSFLLKALSKKLQDGKGAEWEILLLHNKTGGFRIVAYRDGKLVFARLAQNLVGDSIAEIVVGNIEQELQSTFEYLKRLGFKIESTSKVVIVSSAEILEKFDPKVIRATEVNLFPPHKIAELVELPDIIVEKDKFADIFMASFFAAQKKRALKMHDKFTKRLDKLYLAAKCLLVAIALLLTVGVGYQATKFMNVMSLIKEGDAASSEFRRQVSNLAAKNKMLKKMETEDTEKILATHSLYKLLPTAKYRFVDIVSKMSPEFGSEAVIKSISFTDSNSKKTAEANSGKNPNDPNLNELNGYKEGQFSFEMIVEMEFVLPRLKSGKINQTSEEFLVRLKKALSGLQVTFEQAPSADAKKEIDFFADGLAVNHFVTYDAKLKIVPTPSYASSYGGNR